MGQCESCVPPAGGLVLKAAPHLGLTAYDPTWDFPADLDRLAEYSSSNLPVQASRATTVEAGSARDLTITVDGLANVIGDRFKGARVLEVGPKYGIHSLWLDEHLKPSEIVFSDFASGSHLHDQWEGKLRSPHRFVYGDLRAAEGLASSSRSTSRCFSVSSITRSTTCRCSRCSTG